MNDLEQAISNIKSINQFYKSLLRFTGKLEKKEDKIISSASKEELVNAIMKLEKYELLYLNDYISEIKNLDDKIKILEKIKNVPWEWRTDEQLLNYFIKQKNYYIVIQFELNEFLKDDLKEEAVNIINMLNNKLPDEFKNNKYLLEICIQQKKGELINQFNSFIFSPDLVYEYMQELFLTKNLNIENNYSIINNSQFFKLCLSERRFDLLGYFAANLLTDDIIEEYGAEIIKYYKNEIPRKLKNNKKLFDKVIETKRYDLIIYFEDQFITEDILSGYSKPILNELYKIFSNENTYLLVRINITKFMNSKALLKEALEEKKDEIIPKFNSEIIDKEIVDSYGEYLIKISQNEKYRYKYSENIYLFEYCLKNKKYDIINNFNLTFFGDDVIEKYAANIFSAFKEELPKIFYNNEKILDKYLEEGKSDLISKFYSRVFTEKIIKKHTKKLLDIFEKEAPFNLRRNKYLLETVIEEGKFDLISKFSLEAFTEEIIKTHKKILLNIFEKEAPFNLRCNKYLLETVIEEGKFDLISKFHIIRYTEEIIKTHKKILLNIFEKEAPFNLRRNKYLLETVIEEGRFDLISKFSSGAFTEKIIQKYYSIFINEIKQNEKNTSSYLLNKLSKNNNFKKMCYENNETEFFLKFPFQIGDEIVGLDLYSKLLDIPLNELKSKIDILYEKNDEILLTLNPLMLSPKMKELKLEYLLTMGIHSDIQEILVNLNEHELNIFLKLLEIIENNDYDNTPIIYNTLKNFETTKKLINEIDENTINKDQLTNLLLILQEEKNIYSIENKEQLNNDNFNRKIIEQHLKFEKKLKNGEVNIEELKEMLYIKKFGLSKEKFKFIYERYCSNKEIINNSNLPADVKILLLDIYELYNSDDFEKLKNNYLISNISFVDFKTTLFLETSIRKEFTKLYNKELYKVKKEHLLENSRHLITNSECTDKLQNVNYNDKKTDIYVIDGNFNLLIHCLGAYSYYARPNNFLEDWQRPKMTYHGICTSYITNNQIANARAYHPIFGFDEIESRGLLLSANYDIGSSQFNQQYSTTIGMSCHFLPPKDQISNTRHTHNEMVIERILYEGNKCYKRMPSYVVYIVDDINNKYNFMTKDELIKEFKENSIIEKIKTEKDISFVNELLETKQISTEDAYKINCVFYYEETLQAATDINIPIVLVDRLKYAKTEQNKCDELYNQFIKTNNTEYMDLLLETYFNNSIGCIKYTEYDLEYYKYFNEERLDQLYKNILEHIKNQEDINVKIELLINLINLFEKEEQKRESKDAAIKNDKLIPIQDKKLELKQLLEELKDELIRGEKNGTKVK